MRNLEIELMCGKLERSLEERRTARTAAALAELRKRDSALPNRSARHFSTLHTLGLACRRILAALHPVARHAA